MSKSGHSLESLADFLAEAWPRYAGEEKDAQEMPGDQRREEQELGTSPAESLDARTWPASEPDSAWDDAEQVFRDGQIVSGIVTGWNRGGLLVRWDRLQGFVPASQLKEIPLFEDEDSRDEELARWVGEELRLKIIELDRSRDRLVFSERATLWGPKDSGRLLSEIVPGETRRGYVSNLCNFGAFVDLGGIDGLIHVSELSWGRVNHPREVLALGQEIEVHVISVDKANRRIALSLKRLHPDPWTTVDREYQVGQVIEATITNVVDFGAFARIDDGLEGLIHISEFPESEVIYPGELLRPGDRVRVRILRIDSAHHRLGLSMREVNEQPPYDTGPEDASQSGDWDASASLLY